LKPIGKNKRIPNRRRIHLADRIGQSVSDHFNRISSEQSADFSPADISGVRSHKNLVVYFVIRFVHPKHTPRLELKNGIPDHGRTICVVSTLLTSKKSGIRAAELLEEYRLQTETQ
jgi:hypothetical protein